MLSFLPLIILCVTGGWPLMIEARGLSKYYGDFKAISDISFTIRGGEITGLLGPNGAGKTTTLRLLSCYLKPDSGSISVDGKDTVTESLEVKKKIGYLPEAAPLYGDMIVYDYLKFAAELRGVFSQKVIDEVAQTCRITDVMHKNISELSKGYKQRVGFANAIVHDPAILILDEPTSGLDPIEIVEIRNLIKELGRKKTIILSTHILPEVEATCDRVIIINKGSIVADDRTDNLKNLVRGDKEIIIKVAGTDFDTLKQSLMPIDGVRNVSALDCDGLTGAIVVASYEREIRGDIFDIVVKRGWKLYEMREEVLSLEKIFSELASGGLNE